jgi:2-polyprenyl-3-methyl-5-hydroxy-6-metoxy-1,4-benzoquinol methylase
LEFLQHDCLRDELPQGFDVVICTLLLHHLEWDEAIQLLSKMRTSARKAVLVDDLLRSIAGYTLAWVGTRALTRSRIVHVDGPRSVRAAFRLTELHELADAAGLTPARFVPHWPFRCLLHWSRVR